jgi:hypothetical protein
MEKQLLTDFTPFSVSKLVISEAKNVANGRMRIKGKLQEANVKNGNGRIYPKEVLQREVEKYVKGPIASNTSMGELDHPESSIINLNNVSHLIIKVWWDGDNLMGELELLNTPSGKIAQEIISCGIPLGISSRGMGSVQQIGEVVEVQDDFELLCWDLVSVPSTPNAYMTLAVNLSEGKQNNTIFNQNYSKINSLITEIICNQTGVCALC